MSSTATATPAMRQYLDAKRQYRDAIVFFRMGDFYEMFYEDALVAARALELTLTSRSKDAGGNGIPMCGVPFHAADGYIARLVRKGFRVAICRPAASRSATRASASRPDTPIKGLPAANASPCIVAMPIRRPVNEPGPVATAKTSMAPSATPLCSSSVIRSRGRRVAGGSDTSLASSRPTDPSTASAQLPAGVVVSRARTTMDG